MVVDKSKLAVFKRHLDEAGFEYTEHAGVTKSTMTLRVKYEFVYKLKPVLEAAMAESRGGA